MSKQPGLLLMYGTDAFSCQKILTQMVGSFRAKGWRIERVDAVSGLTQLIETLSALPMFDGGQHTLVIATRGDKMILDLALRQHTDPNPHVTLLLHQEGEPKGTMAQLKKELPLQAQLVRNLPARHELEKAATSFCVTEVRDRGKELPETLAAALVKRSGTDYWYLYQEVMKVCDLSDARGDSEITAEVMIQAISGLGEVPVDQLISRVSVRDVRGASRAFGRIRTTSAGNPTVLVCRFLLSNITSWLAAADLHTKGYSVADAASRMEIHPWVYQNVLLPSALRWTFPGLRSLLREVARVDRLTRKGAIDPWSSLVAAVLRCL